MLNKIQYISHGDTPQEQLYHIESVLAAGQQWVQYRFKNTTSTTLWQTAEQVKKLCQQYNATLIINDYVDLAKAIDADGVHLGLTDLSITQAREYLTNKIIGGTANTFEDILLRHYEGCDYIGLGPYQFTTTKQQLSPILGLSGYSKLIKQMRDTDINIPIIAIGGIQLEDVRALKQTGIHGIAISGLLQHSQDKQTLIQQLNSILI
ncbi:thiamine phosphate synthase [Myroides marinus]|uniref:thiamine phosphate synthase n=1 Tax=Myroides marinus TaxID=703342 RepID=UPI002578FE7E|nr:thiamine phosphate synthase [Myroides marinus]MDM1378099.1 thiamine phosphate synthase [Myroides marinus]MDM1385515.1 thiamine phosphate synthase [Myroides marinus]MDM1392728.1 thiamine phosphate synthase [Myroides marinus]